MPPLTPEQQRAETLGWIIDQLSLAAIAKGQVFSPERLRINAEDLIDIPQAALQEAFGKARRELDYAPTVVEIRRLALADKDGQRDAESRAAWDLVTKHVSKWGRWGEDYLHAFIEKDAPVLPPRITDSVRRTGGWGAYLGLSYNTDDHRRDAAFQQKRFYEEYKVWERVEGEAVELKQLLPAPEATRLIEATTMPRLAAELAPVAPPLPPPKAGRTEELTDAELADRRRLLRQQAQAIAKRRAGGDNGTE